ncbi:uncharacterized protein LOC134429361 isoform X2 [Melospiza melodia melodia]|uniref:uncharacterized protein LOC134429361 isoform X2 n=1 Tax=Melospiza melodia melodia TaxID=1914991 RepID=UPI002FD32550
MSQAQEQPFGSGILGYIQFLQISMCQIQEWDIGIQQWDIRIYSIAGPGAAIWHWDIGIYSISPNFHVPDPGVGYWDPAVGYWDIFNYRAAFPQISMSQIQQWDIGIYSIPDPGAAIWQWDIGIYSIPGLLFPKFPCPRPMSSHLAVGYWDIFNYRAAFLQISMSQIHQWDIGIQQWDIGIYSIPGPGAAIWQWILGIYSIPGLLFPKFPCPRSSSGILGSSSGILGYIQFQIQEQPFGSGILGYIPFQGCFSPKFPCPRPMSSHLAVGYWDIFHSRAAFPQISKSQIQEQPLGSGLLGSSSGILGSSSGILGYIPFQGCFSPGFSTPPWLWGAQHTRECF